MPEHPDSLYTQCTHRSRVLDLSVFFHCQCRAQRLCNTGAVIRRAQWSNDRKSEPCQSKDFSHQCPRGQARTLDNSYCVNCWNNIEESFFSSIIKILCNVPIIICHCDGYFSKSCVTKPHLLSGVTLPTPGPAWEWQLVGHFKLGNEVHPRVTKNSLVLIFFNKCNMDTMIEEH